MNVTDKFIKAGLVDLPEDFTEHIWCFTSSGFCVAWNSENNLEDLHNEEGMTFVEEINREGVEVDGDIIFTLSDSCGGEGQVIFSLRNKVESSE